MAILLPEGKQSFTNGIGLPLVGGKVYTYAAGTNTPQVTYSDAAGTIPNTNPVILDARGEATIFWSGTYKVVLRDALDVLIWTVDNVVAAASDPTLRADLAGANGGSLVFSTGTGPNAIARSEADRALDAVNVMDYIPANLRAAIRAGTSTVDITTYAQAACVAANRGQVTGDGPGGYVDFPSGRYNISRIGIRKTVLRLSKGTVIKAVTGGTEDTYVLDAMTDRDGVTFNTSGAGGVIGGGTLDCSGSTRSGIRTYGGGQMLRDTTVIDAADVAFAIGLPIWSVFSQLHAVRGKRGFFTFHNSPGDAGTSSTFIACWADSQTQYGFHISQLFYSTFINCPAQDCGLRNWFLDGSLNGTPICVSLQFIGCAVEITAGNTSVPFYMKRGRQISILGPRIIGTPLTDFFVLDDFTGSVRDSEAIASPVAGKYTTSIINHTAGNGAIALEGTGTHTIDANTYPFISELGPTVNGVRRLAAGGFLVGGYVATTAVLAATNNNYGVPINCAVVRLTPPGGGASITGITMLAAGGAFDGQRLLLHNTSLADTITLTHASVASASGNRFNLSGGVNTVIPVLGSVELWYDAAQQRWHDVR